MVALQQNWYCCDKARCDKDTCDILLWLFWIMINQRVWDPPWIKRTWTNVKPVIVYDWSYAPIFYENTILQICSNVMTNANPLGIPSKDMTLTNELG